MGLLKAQSRGQTAETGKLPQGHHRRAPRPGQWWAWLDQLSLISQHQWPLQSDFLGTFPHQLPHCPTKLPTGSPVFPSGSLQQPPHPPTHPPAGILPLRPLTWLVLPVPMLLPVLAVWTTAPPSTPFARGPAALSLRLAHPGPPFSDVSSWGAGTPTVKKLFKLTTISSPQADLFL